MPMINRITIDDILSWGPCSDCSREYLGKLYGRKKYTTLLTILSDERVSPADRVWVALNCTLIPRRELLLFECDTATRALCTLRESGSEPDQRSWDAVRVMRRYVDGRATTEEMKEAARAAWAAAWDTEAKWEAWAAWAAAWEAWAAAWVPAQASARAAACEAEATWASARAAACEAEAPVLRAEELRTQLADLRRIVKKLGGK